MILQIKFPKELWRENSCSGLYCSADLHFFWMSLFSFGVWGWGEEVYTGKVLGFLGPCNWSFLRGEEENLWAPVMSRMILFIRSPSYFCFPFIGLISCHSEVFLPAAQKRTVGCPNVVFFWLQFVKSLWRTLAWSPFGLIGGQWLVRSRASVGVRTRTLWSIDPLEPHGMRSFYTDKDNKCLMSWIGS